MIRSVKERIVQTFSFEVIGLLLVAPLYSYYSNEGIAEDLALLIILSVVATLWAGIHNSIYDWLEWHIANRLANKRPFNLRALHAISLELTCVVISVPLILLMTDLSFPEALLVDLLLTISYIIYGFIFHYTYDYLRPIRTGGING